MKLDDCKRLLKESEPLSIGGHVFEWDGRDDEDRRVVSNFYIVTVEGGGCVGEKSRCWYKIIEEWNVKYHNARGGILEVEANG